MARGKCDCTLSVSLGEDYWKSDKRERKIVCCFHVLYDEDQIYGEYTENPKECRLGSVKQMFGLLQVETRIMNLIIFLTGLLSR